MIVFQPPASFPVPRVPGPAVAEWHHGRPPTEDTSPSPSVPSLPQTRLPAASTSAVPPRTPAQPRSTLPPGSAAPHSVGGGGRRGGSGWPCGAARWRGGGRCKWLGRWPPRWRGSGLYRPRIWPSYAAACWHRAVPASEPSPVETFLGEGRGKGEISITG